MSKINFDSEYYIANNHDLKVIMDHLPPNKKYMAALNHYFRVGKNENRKYRFLGGKSSEPTKDELFKSIVESHQVVSSQRSSSTNKKHFDKIDMSIDYAKEEKIIAKLIKTFQEKYSTFKSGERDV